VSDAADLTFDSRSVPAIGDRDRLVRIAINILAGALALWVSIAAAPPILGDDAAIGLRYAERIANGQGFTYNDHERVCGTSSPLWTLLISLGPRAGLTVEHATRVLASLFFTTAAVLASMVALEVGGVLAALCVALAIPGDAFWRTQALTGLELPLSLSLGLATILALGRRRESLAGVLLGLAIVTKLDAIALMLGVAVSYMVLLRRIPLRMLAIAALVTLPWYVFAIAYFGSPLPQSLAAKLAHGRAATMDHLWIARIFALDLRYGLWILAVMSLVVSTKVSLNRRLIIASIFAWFLIHGVAYSWLNLGDLYPWYVGIPAALCWIAAAGAASNGTRGWRTAIALVMIVAALPNWRTTISSIVRPRIELWHAIDTDRRLAGIFIDQFAASDEIVGSGFGWIAYEGHRAFVDGTSLNSRILLDANYVVLPVGGKEIDALPREFLPLATFDVTGRLYPGHRGSMVFGLPDSAIAVAGANERAVDATRLQDASLIAAWRLALERDAR
jgi:hypothetical protein